MKMYILNFNFLTTDYLCTISNNSVKWFWWKMIFRGFENPNRILAFFVIDRVSP